MKKIILKIEGMSCSACQNHIEKYLNKQEGVKASVNLVMATALIEYDDNISIVDLERYIKESGYKSLGVYDPQKENKKDYTKYYLIGLAFLLLFIMYIAMGHMIGLPVIINPMVYPIRYALVLFILIIPFLVFGFNILKQGIKNLFYKSPNMDTLVTIGILACLIYSLINLILIIKGNNRLVNNLYFESIATIIYFIKLGRYIDKQSKEKTKGAIKELVQITPLSALLKTKDGDKEITIDEVKKGDILVCKPGMKIAVDGVIKEGVTHINEAFITGEAKAIKKKPNDPVIAGSINIDGYILYEAKKIGKDSTISEIVRLVINASNTKAPISRLADKISGIFVPGIILIAIFTLIGYLLFGYPLSVAITAFVTVLVVACPCSLGLATPLAIVISEGIAAKLGILIKNSATLENAHKIDTIIFDKTGTLTYGDLKVAKVYNYSKYDDNYILNIVANLEQNSAHPIASAFRKYLKNKLEIKDYKEMEGLGITGVYQKQKIFIGNGKLCLKLKIDNKKEEDELALKGNSIVYVIIDNKIRALIGVKDIIRTKAKEAIKELELMGKKVIMLSGDNEKTAKEIANELNIKEVMADCLPQDKELYLNKLKQDKHLIMMVGDGINDAPSLARSDIGVSINGGTDIAIDSADIILMQTDLRKIGMLINLSKKTIKIIKQNLFWAFFYNILMIPIAIGVLKPLGISLSPMLASIAMVISSLTVVINSGRLRKWKGN